MGDRIQMNYEHVMPQVDTQVDTEVILPQDWIQVDPQDIQPMGDAKTATKDTKYGIQINSEPVLSQVDTKIDAKDIINSNGVLVALVQTLTCLLPLYWTDGLPVLTRIAIVILMIPVSTRASRRTKLINEKESKFILHQENTQINIDNVLPQNMD